jgi:hypothetical protein
MEDQGIMALPQAGMQAPTAQPVAQIGEAEQAAFEQARMQVNPKDFGDSLLEEAKNADPETVDEFVQLLNSINLPMEVIDLLGQVVDIILAEPQNYPQIRAALLADGLPEDLLPPEFDPNYFAALNMALDQMSARSMAPEPQAFAKGGIVQLNPIAASLANQGRRGDRLLAHITHGEARLLRRRGGSGTINPKTGLPEFFIDKIAKGLKDVGRGISNAVKSLGRGIKKFASSNIGRIVTTVALGFFLGPAAAAAVGLSAPAAVAAMTGFVGGFGSSMLAGKNIKDSLKMGALGAVTAGVTTGLTVPGAFNPSATAPTSFSEALSQQTDKFTGGIKSLMGTTPPSGTEATPLQKVTGATPGAAPTTTPAPAGLNVGDVEAQPGGFYGETTSTRFAPHSQNVFKVQLDAAGNPIPGKNGYAGDVIDYYGKRMAQNLPPPTTGPAPSLFEQATEGAKKMGKGIMDFYNPQPDAAEVSKLYEQKLADLTLKFPKADANVLQTKAMEMAEKAAAPMFGTTSRIVGTGLGALALSGGFKQEPATRPNLVPAQTGYDLLRARPDIFGVTVGGGQTVYPGSGVMYAASGGIAAVSPRKYNLGGYAGGGKPQHFPRRTGQISGPGTETSDSIPAMLSDGEFVMTARAVRGAGGGSRREGAKRMYQMMRAFERKA